MIRDAVGKRRTSIEKQKWKKSSRVTVKFRKLAPGLIFFKGPFWGAYFWRGLCTEGNLRLKIDWASLVVGRKFTIFSLFYFVFEGSFPSTSPPGGLYLDGRFNGGCFASRVWGLTFGGAYTWRGLFLEFYGISHVRCCRNEITVINLV